MGTLDSHQHELTLLSKWLSKRVFRVLADPESAVASSCKCMLVLILTAEGAFGKVIIKEVGEFRLAKVNAYGIIVERLDARKHTRQGKIARV